MEQLLNALQKSLSDRERQGIRRTLRTYSEPVDFFSNDYLGFAKDKSLHRKIIQYYTAYPEVMNGATGSRLISGNSAYTQKIEKFLAEEHRVEAALLFPSGYSANVALFSALLQKNDTILVDAHIHRSVHDGCRLSFAKKIKFRHNDTAHLESLLQKTPCRCFIAIESLYSMHGDFAPLSDICFLAQKYQAALVVDEAHAFGVFGYGLVHQQYFQDKVLATVVTYGKAMGMHGAVILADKTVIDYLVNYAAPFIYSTAMPDFHVAGLRIGYDHLKKHAFLSEKLQKNLLYFHTKNVPVISDKKSPIQLLVCVNTPQLRSLQIELEKVNLQTFAVFPPTVRKGEERLRICLHAFNTKNEIDQLCEIIRKYE